MTGRYGGPVSAQNMPSRDDITEMLIQLEASVHEHGGGWGQSPFLAIIHQLDDDTLEVRSAVLRVTYPPSGWLRSLADAFLRHGPVAQKFAAQYGESFRGVVFVCEAWVAMADTADELRQFRDTPLDENIPGSFKIRMVSAVDINARLYQVHRATEEDMAVDVGGEHNAVLTGVIHQALCDVVKGAVRAIPELAEKLPDLETRFVMTLDEGLDVFEMRGNTNG